MNYLQLINQFWEFRKRNFISSQEADLYFYFLSEFNLQRWPESIAVSLELIVASTGLSKPSAIKARERLTELELIWYENGKVGRGATTNYFLGKGKEKGKQKGKEKGKNIYPFDKEEIPPIPPKEEIIYKTQDNLASLDTRDAHTRMSEMGSIESLRMHFSQRMARESLMMSNKLTHEQYKMLCEEILGEWLIAEGNAFPVDADRKKHFISTLRIKAEILRKQRGAARTRQESKHELLTSALNAVNNAINGTDKQPQDSADDLPF